MYPRVAEIRATIGFLTGIEKAKDSLIAVTVNNSINLNSLGAAGTRGTRWKTASASPSGPARGPPEAPCAAQQARCASMWDTMSQI